MMRLGFAGGAMEIGGSCIYLRTDGRGILLDAGIRQGGSRDPVPDFSMLQELGGVDAILVSHAHMDHIGTLPLVSRAYPHAPVYMTPMTADLARVLLADSLKLMNRSEGELPHYAQEDVTAMLNRIHSLNFRVRFPLFEDMAVTLYPAGHIAGAACIFLECGEGTLFYSGDFCAFPQKTIEGIHIPKLRPDVAVVETTYGDRLHANRQVEENRLVSLVAECVRDGGKVLIPAFALGRAQEVLLLLKAAIQNGQLPPVPVYADGMVRDINRMYERNPVYLRGSLGRSVMKGNEPFYTKEIQPVPPEQNREELLGKPGPAVFVSSSGMLSGGPSVTYARRIASMENGCIILTGYQDEESPGRKLLDLLEETEGAGERTLSLDGVTVPVRCRVCRAGLSAHGDQGEIRGLLERLSPRDLFLVHGDPEVVTGFGKSLNTDYRRRVFLPECGAVYTLDYRNKRKQLSGDPGETMGRKEPLEDSKERELWEYVREHYPRKALTCEELFFIWSGRNSSHMDEAAGLELAQLQTRLRKSVYFSPDSRRLFLFHANSEEEVSASLAPKEWTAQQLEVLVRSLFGEFDWKKISFYPEERKILLNFDFPDRIDRESFETRARELAGETGWQIRVAPAMNHTAAASLLEEFLGGRLRKISYFLETRVYEVTVTGTETGDAALENVFLERTGWRLRLRGDGADGDGGAGRTPAKDRADQIFLPGDSPAKPMEQNMVLYCVDQAFEGQKHSVCKKSVRTDSQGKYLELAFLSPEVGRRYGELLAQLATQMQWRITIGDSVNQNGVFQTVAAICGAHGILLRQNPSYLPQRRMVQIRTVTDLTAEQLQAVQEEIREQTGLTSEFL